MTPEIWHFIEDLPENWENLESSELDGLASAWKEQSHRLKSSEAIQDFNERLRREWSIETGVIENLYSIDRGITQLLIEKGIHASYIPHGSTNKPTAEVVALIEDQRSALEGLFDFVKQTRSLSTSYIKALQEEFTRNQTSTTAIDPFGNKITVELIRGAWKTMPNNPKRSDGSVFYYCPPEHVDAEMDRLVGMHQNHMEQNIPPEVEAAWLHHRFTQIHPFQDGNGRVARSLATLIFLRAGLFPLVITRDERDQYITASELADDGDLKPLISLFMRLQTRSLIRAISLSEDVLKYSTQERHLMDAVSTRLQERKRQIEQAASTLARQLESHCMDRMSDLADKLTQEFKRFGYSYEVSADTSTMYNDSWFRAQIVELARRYGYYANTYAYRRWLRLCIKEERRANIVISFHGLGQQPMGVMAVSGFIEFRDKDEEHGTAIEGPYPLTTDPFQFTHNESQDKVIVRFNEWLENALLVGIDHWRKQL